MKSLICFFALFFATGVFADSTYGQLAKTQIDDSIGQLSEAVKILNDGTLPHEAKTLRKVIGRLRDMIDIFVYALPVDSKDDFFFELRRNLDTGYEQVGFFKDLYDVQGVSDPADATYDDKEVKKLRKPVLLWLASYEESKFQARLLAYAACIDASMVGKHDKKELSKFYWKQLKGQPSFDTDASASLHLLVDGLLERARDEQKITLAMDDILQSDDIETFHDFRKRVRAVVEICEYFPAELGLDADGLKQLAVFDDLVTRYGDLHDDIIRFERAEAKGDKSKAKKIEKRVHETWKELKVWQKATVELKL